jgi:hypothetical protein
MKSAWLVTLTIVSAFLIAGCGGGSKSSNTPAANNTSSSSSSSLVQPEVYAQEKMDVSSLNQAIQQFNAAEGHYPKDLNELVPNYIAQVPAAPPGYTINYDPTTGTVTAKHQ